MSRSYCHLCDDMIVALKEFGSHFQSGFDFEVVDVDSHPSLEAKWGDKVPVLLDGNVEICHYFLDSDGLAHHLGQQGKPA